MPYPTQPFHNDIRKELFEHDFFKGLNETEKGNLVHVVSRLRVIKLSKIDLGVTEDEFINAFENGMERYNKDVIFRKSMQTLFNGGNCLNVMSDLFNLIDAQDGHIKVLNERLLSQPLYGLLPPTAYYKKLRFHI